MTRSFVSDLCHHAVLLPLCCFFLFLPIVHSQPEPTPLTTPCPVVLPTTSRIVGGTLIESPYMVSFLTTQGACSGTLITPTVILTARHCEIDTLTRAFISSKNGLDGTAIPIRSVASHPRDDIMLVRLARPADVEPVKILANPELPSDWSFVRAQGYGIQSAFPFPSDSLQRFVDSPVIPKALCEQISGDLRDVNGISISENPAFPDDFVCTGYLQSASCTVCSGDSGGAVFSLLRGDPVLLGIISSGVALCTLPGTTSYSVRVSSYIEWLDEQDVQYDAVTELSETFVTSEGAGGNNGSTPRVPVLVVEEVQVGPSIGAGAIAGITFGAAAAVLIVLSAAVFIVNRSRKNNEIEPPADNGENGGASAATGASLMPSNQPDPVPEPTADPEMQSAPQPSPPQTQQLTFTPAGYPMPAAPPPPSPPQTTSAMYPTPTSLDPTQPTRLGPHQ